MECLTRAHALDPAACEHRSSGLRASVDLTGATAGCSCVLGMGPKNEKMPAPTAFILNLPLGLAVIYGLALLVWYELLRSAVGRRVGRRRSSEAQLPTLQSLEEAERAESEREAAEQEAAEASEPDPARRLFYLARKAAKAEQDLAIQTANAATGRTVERIERRYREIAAELDQEEAERITAQ